MRRGAALAAAALAISVASLARFTPAEDKAPPRVERMKVGGVSREDDAAAEKYFTNTELVDQHGRVHRFYEGLLRGRKVLINFAFTSCKGACPTMTANLARVQELLRARGERVTLLTITVDPENDTPAALKQYAARFKASEGWYFLTGAPANVAAVLRRLGGQVRRPEEHMMTLLVGDTSTGVWLKTFATEQPETLVHLVQHLNDPQ
ncbi:photosynthetic protein synthase I [Sorangium cellulosum]|uniref:Photosynthetic protein synthase I n=1 Tax=Sorangium cellulosum TaxID=56 RepID=A0A2L0EPC4_SORCE|nr:SCO family protein [Sorangium cellulosum]AUX41163.1 photosynthetic protein synthase I [Sorangium cellulosum]